MNDKISRTFCNLKKYKFFLLKDNLNTRVKVIKTLKFIPLSKFGGVERSQCGRIPRCINYSRRFIDARQQINKINQQFNFEDKNILSLQALMSHLRGEGQIIVYQYRYARKRKLKIIFKAEEGCKPEIGAKNHEK